jgi:hypothetical protein
VTISATTDDPTIAKVIAIAGMLLMGDALAGGGGAGLSAAESGAVIGFTQGTLNSANLGKGVKQGVISGVTAYQGNSCYLPVVSCWVGVFSQPLKTQFKITKPYLITSFYILKKALKRDNRYQCDKKRKLCKRCAAIEPIIGHLKSDCRLSRNLLKGQIGDEINVLMAACAWNLRKWLVATTIFLSYCL